MNTSNPSKFVGKKASVCRKCDGTEFYVNPMGGVSCVSCYPPRRPEHILLRLICESDVWTTPDQAFYVAHENSGGLGNRSPDLTSPPQAETPATAAASRDAETRPPQPDRGRVVIRRKSSEPYLPAELAFVEFSGGILDQMAESLKTRREAISRPGETIAERDARTARFRGKTPPRRLAPSNVGAVQAVLTAELRFVAEDLESRRFDVFPVGTKCLLFPGRSVPENDPEAADIRESMAIHRKAGRRLAVVRLASRLRMVNEDHVKVA